MKEQVYVYPLSNFDGRALKTAEVIYIGDILYLKSNDRIIAKRFNGNRCLIGAGVSFTKETFKHISYFMGISDLSFYKFQELVKVGQFDIAQINLEIEVQEKREW